VVSHTLKKLKESIFLNAKIYLSYPSCKYYTVTYIEFLLLLETWNRGKCFGSIYEYIGSVAENFRAVISVSTMRL
jgi:hypothetical protein